MSESKKREVGETVVFDVTAGGYILPGELKKQLGGRIFIRWVQLDGERATITAISGMGQYDIVFRDGYFIKGIPAEYFTDVLDDIDDETETPDPAPEEGVQPQAPKTFNEVMDRQLDEMSAQQAIDALDTSMDQQMDVLEEEALHDEPACTKMPVFCTVCVKDEGKCSTTLLAPDENGFMRCPNCRGSYGRLIPEEEQDAKED